MTIFSGVVLAILVPAAPCNISTFIIGRVHRDIFSPSRSRKIEECVRRNFLRLTRRVVHLLFMVLFLSQLPLRGDCFCAPGVPRPGTLPSKRFDLFLRVHAGTNGGIDPKQTVRVRYLFRWRTFESPKTISCVLWAGQQTSPWIILCRSRRVRRRIGMRDQGR